MVLGVGQVVAHERAKSPSAACELEHARRRMLILLHVRRAAPCDVCEVIHQRRQDETLHGILPSHEEAFRGCLVHLARVRGQPAVRLVVVRVLIVLRVNAPSHPQIVRLGGTPSTERLRRLEHEARSLAQHAAVLRVSRALHVPRKSVFSRRDAPSILPVGCERLEQCAVPCISECRRRRLRDGGSRGCCHAHRGRRCVREEPRGAERRERRRAKQVRGEVALRRASSLSCARQLGERVRDKRPRRRHVLPWVPRAPELRRRREAKAFGIAHAGRWAVRSLRIRRRRR
mmetsp:Transcript_7169/g.18542  ORF Transcript_7169/g.18542 Transcript_7169/m.18542 type:complete len:288 (+) Transcript_7169:560-1423(+)